MDGDELQAFTVLYERHAGAVHGYAARRCDRETAEEVVAQVFAIAWRRRASLPDEPLPWLYGAARRVLSEQRRGALRRHRLHERLRAHSTPEESGEPALELSDAALSQALRRLPAADREALLLTYWEELSPAQAAHVLGCSRAALAVRLHRARRRVRAQLEAAGGEPTRGAQHERSCVTETESI